MYSLHPQNICQQVMTTHIIYATNYMCEYPLSGSPFAKVVQPLLQLYWAMYLHVFGTGGSIDSLATRCPLSTFQPNYVDGVVFAVCPCRIVSRSGSDIGVLQYVHANHL